MIKLLSLSLSLSHSPQNIYHQTLKTFIFSFEVYDFFSANLHKLTVAEWPPRKKTKNFDRKLSKKVFCEFKIPFLYFTQETGFGGWEKDYIIAEAFP